LIAGYSSALVPAGGLFAAASGFFIHSFFTGRPFPVFHCDGAEEYKKPEPATVKYIAGENLYYTNHPAGFPK